MAGIHPLNFWLSNLTWDMVMFTIVDLVATLILALSDKRYKYSNFNAYNFIIKLFYRNIFNTNGAEFAFFLIYFLYGMGGILMAYVFSFATNSGRQKNIYDKKITQLIVDFI